MSVASLECECAETSEEWVISKNESRVPVSEESPKPSVEASVVDNGTGVAGVMWTGIREEPCAKSGREMRSGMCLENLAGRSDRRKEGKGIALIDAVELGRAAPESVREGCELCGGPKVPLALGMPVRGGGGASSVLDASYFSLLSERTGDDGAVDGGIGRGRGAWRGCGRGRGRGVLS